MAKKHTPTPEEIIKIMKDASEALKNFLDKDNNIDYTDQEEYDLERWSNALRCYSTKLNSRIIYK